MLRPPAAAPAIAPAPHRAPVGAHALAAGELAVLAAPPRSASWPMSSASVVTRLKYALEAAEAQAGWEHNQGAAHPTGGYHRRHVSSRADNGQEHLVWAVFFGEHDLHHRLDGPSSIDYDSEGAAVRATWHSRGARHRGDGPAIVGADPTNLPTFFHHGLALSPLGSTGPHVPRAAAACEHYLTSLAAGHTPAQAIIWLRCATAIGAEATAGLREAGGESDLLAQALDAGMDAGADVGTLSEVATGALPLSWAVAGRS